MEKDQLNKTNISESINTNTEQNNLKSASFINKRSKIIVGAIVGLLALLIFILVGVNLLKSKGEKAGKIPLQSKTEMTGKMPPSEPENVLLATVGEKKIFRNDVKQIALEQYLESAVTNSVIKSMLNVAVERALLDREAAARKIIIPKQRSVSEYYELLKAKVLEGQVLSVTEQDISWWIPPPTLYEQKPEFQTQRQNQYAMASEIEKRLRNGDDPLKVAQDMIIKYPIFAQTLGVNGGLVSKITNPSYSSPRTLEYNSQDADKPFFKMLYSMKTGEIRKGIWDDGSGGAVIKVIKLTKGKSFDYQQWLTDNTKKFVVYNDDAISKL